MSLTLRIALIIVTLIFILLIFKAIRKKEMNITYSLFWIAISILLIVAVCVPNLIETIAKQLGFEMPANMLFCLTIFIAFYLIFNLMVIASKEHRKNIALVQEVSLLKKRVAKLEENINGK